MQATAPAASAAARLSNDDAAPIARSPRAVATSMAASPTPPPAPRTSTVSPRWWTMRPKAYSAVAYDCSIAAARVNDSDSGIGTTDAAGSATRPGGPPRPHAAITRWPTGTGRLPSAVPSVPVRVPVAVPGAAEALPTSSPTELTTPATSLPGLNGVGGLIWYLPCTNSASTKLTPAASTSTTT